MRQVQSILLTLSIIFMVFGCSNNEDVMPTGMDCVFEQIDGSMDGMIDPTERMIMDECAASTLVTKDQIEQNLIGEWQLVGHGTGWLSGESQPCGYIKIVDNELTFRFESSYIDTTVLLLWELETLPRGTEPYFRLKVTPDVFDGLYIDHFCEDYMFGDGTPFDGNMYLYEKVK